LSSAHRGSWDRGPREGTADGQSQTPPLVDSALTATNPRRVITKEATLTVGGAVGAVHPPDGPALHPIV
jgi:hypothetical protein